MSQLVEFVSDDGPPILIQVTPPYEDIEPVGRLDDAIKRVQGSFRDAMTMVRQVAADFSSVLSRSDVESAEVELNLQFTAKGNLCIVEGQGQAALKVKIKSCPERLSVPFFESAVDQALLLVRGADGRALGTAFVVDDRGTALTCHHVVAGRSDLRLESASGASPRCLNIEPVAQYDMAVLCTDGTDIRPLPLAAEEQQTFHFWTKGFHRLGGSVRGAFPAEGTSIGTTKIVYGHDDTNYVLDEAMVLRRDSFDRGLSGSPVLDLETGAVVAIVVGKQRGTTEQTGYASPIRPVLRAALVADLVNRNGIVAPAFGRHLNQAGARELCAAQSVGARQILEAYARIDLGHYVHRTTFHECIEKFLRGSDDVLAIVGPSGNGKSTELARIAAQRSDRVILVSAAMLDPHSRDLAEAVADELRALKSFPPPPVAPADAMAAVLRDSSAGLLVLLDAVNEAPAAILRNSQAWVTRSVSWLRQAGARLVLTCRPEYWTDLKGVFPAGSLHLITEDEGRTPKTELTLGELSVAECVSAMDAYGVPETALDHQAARHPLMLRLYADLAPESPQRRVRALELLDKYITDQANRVALRRGKPVHRIREAFFRIAADMLAAGGYVIDQRSYDEAFGDADTGDAAAAEHVLVRAGKSYRFAFDAVADALQSETLDVQEVLRNKNFMDMIQGKNRHMLGPLVYALTRYGDEHGATALEPLLGKLWQFAVMASDVPLGSVVERVVIDLVEPAPCMSVLFSIADDAVRFWRAVDSPRRFPREAALETWLSKQPAFWAALRLLVEARLALLRILLLIEDDRGWREKDWARLGMPSLSEWRELASSTVLNSPMRAIHILATWLDDETPLGTDPFPEANLGNVAQALMFETRFEHLDELCNVLAATANQGAGNLLRVLCETMPREMCMVVHKWSTSKTSAHHEAAVNCAERIRYSNLLLEQHVRLLISAMQALLAEVVDGSILRDRILGLMLSTPETAPGFLAPALERFRQGSEVITPGSFGISFARHVDKIVPIFKDVFNITRDPDLAVSIVRMLISEGPPDVAMRAVSMARGQLPVLPGFALQLSLVVESLIYKGIPELNHPVAQLIRLLFSWHDARRALVYGLTLPQEAASHDAVRRRLLTELLAAEDDTHNLLIVVGLCAERPELAGATDALAIIRARIGADDVDARLLGSVITNRSVGPVLLDWLDTGLVDGGGQHMRRFRDLVAADHSPRDAALRVYKE